jgi:hypothetical protein
LAEAQEGALTGQPQVSRKVSLRKWLNGVYKHEEFTKFGSRVLSLKQCRTRR